jgi:hypothetical protein
VARAARAATEAALGQAATAAETEVLVILVEKVVASGAKATSAVVRAWVVTTVAVVRWVVPAVAVAATRVASEEEVEKEVKTEVARVAVVGTDGTRRSRCRFAKNTLSSTC